MGLSLKLVIGGFAALIIALTTVVALVITQSFTMSAMRDIGCDHATTIVQAANLKVSSFFSQAVVQSRNMQNLVRLNAWPLPTEVGVGWYTNYMMQMVTMHKLFNFSYFTNILFYAPDGSWVILYPPTSPTTYYASLTMGPGRSPYGMITYNIENDTVLRTYTSSVILDKLGSALYLSNLGLGLFGQAWAEVGFGNINGKNVGLAGLYSALVNASGTRIGLFGASFAVDTVSAMLKSVRLTKKFASLPPRLTQHGARNDSQQHGTHVARSLQSKRVVSSWMLQHVVGRRWRGLPLHREHIPIHPAPHAVRRETSLAQHQQPSRDRRL